jgi:meso-butanediol dehydrogenase / (S,S)-butanediol dehydrogenase / diacetyl reductase
VGRLSGKIALVTGTAGGIGRASALTLAREGARVVGCDLHPAGSDDTVRLARDAGGEMTAMAPVDLSSEAGADSWVTGAVAVYGGVDILVNNASAIRFGPISSLSVEDWSFTIRNELDIVFLVTRAVWPHLVARGGGSIVNIASISATRGAFFRPRWLIRVQAATVKSSRWRWLVRVRSRGLPVHQASIRIRFKAAAAALCSRRVLSRPR